jgi:hypothetical protein
MLTIRRLVKNIRRYGKAKLAETIPKSVRNSIVSKCWGQGRLNDPLQLPELPEELR